MSVYVDQLQTFPTSIRCFQGGSCHLTADTLAELHAMAKALGLKRSWFQDHPLAPHYDLTPGRRAKAIGFGALEVSAREQARRRRASRAKFTP